MACISVQDGREFDIDMELYQLDPKERLRRQRLNLRQMLRIDLSPDEVKAEGFEEVLGGRDLSPPHS
jgi:hypothetical protein